MMITDFSTLDLSQIPTPAYIIDEVAVEANLKKLRYVADSSGAKVLAALKAFSLPALAEKTAKYLDGVCTSGLHEALLGQEFYHCPDKKGEIHVYSAAFSESDFVQLLTIADHIVLNSLSQWRHFQALMEDAQQKRPELSFGLRINPEHSEACVELYDPCAPGSRLGIVASQLDSEFIQQAIASGLLSGLHFHTLCEQGFEPLARTLDVVEEKFGSLLHQLKWLNLGGGHHITAENYAVERLISRIKKLRKVYQIQVYLEPGEAVAIGTGMLATSVLDISFNQLPQAILDTSATCHMPDTLEMPYRAEIVHAAAANEKAHTYRLGGLTCLAGDVMGDYSFDAPLNVGQVLLFEDMSHYTFVKMSTFNGCRLPALVLWHSESGKVSIVREFDYSDFRSRLM
ncbi:MAG: carboxynorspermidine decarboxylase [Pseudomonadales bacterium]|nr:carboxynorspermidine decarboxylase [Pseudomonadales bacterium]